MINSRGVIYTTLGVYDTDSNRTTLYDRSTIVTSGGQTLTADTIFYDRNAGFGEAFGNLEAVDSFAQCGCIWRLWLLRRSSGQQFWWTGRAILKHFGEADTLYLHARYLQRRSCVWTACTFEADTLPGQRRGRGSTPHACGGGLSASALLPAVTCRGARLDARFTEADTMLRMCKAP